MPDTAFTELKRGNAPDTIVEYLRETPWGWTIKLFGTRDRGGGYTITGVVRDAEDWTGAFDSLMAYARRYGAMYLPIEAIYGLDDWLSTTLLEEIDRQEVELLAVVADAL